MSRPTPKPWPMKWVALVTIACLAVYTALTLHFRKPGHVYQPYKDNADRVTVSRLRNAGYQRITANAERPAEPQRAAAMLRGPLAEPTDYLGGLPEELKETLVEHPKLPQAISQVQAPGEANNLMPYTFHFTCALPDNKQVFSGTYVYVKDDEIAVVPDFTAIEGELLARTADSAVQLTIPAGMLRPGTYHVTLAGERQSKRWTLQVH